MFVKVELMDPWAGPPTTSRAASKGHIAFLAYLLLCALPLISETYVSWVANGTGGGGIYAYGVAWSAVFAVVTTCLALLVMPILATLAVFDGVRAAYKALGGK